MNNLSHFDRNKILFNSDYANILLPTSLYFQKNKTYVDITQTEEKSNLILNDKNINLNSYTTKSSKGINLMFDYKSNINRKKKQNHFFNYTNNHSPNRLNFNNKKINKNEENKNNNFYNFKKFNSNTTSGRFSEISTAFNKPSSNIVAKYYANNKIFVKKRQNFSINFNLNSPNANCNINKTKNTTRNKKLNKQCRSVSNSNMKYQSYSNINEIYKNYQNKEDYEYNKDTLCKNQTKRGESYDMSNPYFYNPITSNTYLNTENNINSRNIRTQKSYSIHNKNYNLMNIDYSSERNNTYSNLNSNKLKNENDIQRQNTQQNKIKSQYKNFKYSFKTRDAYICKENRINKKSLKQFYEKEFNNINDENDKNWINIEKNEYKFNNEDLCYKECLSTNHSTCTNEINKANDKEISKRNQRQIINKNSKNPEMFHFFMVSYLQKGKKLGNKFN